MAESGSEAEFAGPGAAPVLHVMVVGFHHQKGATVEYSYPPLQSRRARGDVDFVEQSITCLLPPEWRHLPHIALPDGCHNYDQDSVYFTLPWPTSSRGESTNAGHIPAHLPTLPFPSLPSSSSSSSSSSVSQRCEVFGVACCRQIDVRDLQEKQLSREITRSTVQKSVCVLTLYPTFGFVEAKLRLVTHAFFNSKDFSDVSILRDAYTHLNASLSPESVSSTIDIGLSPRSQVLRYEHRLLVVFKALLLRKRVMVYGSPCKALCSAVLSIASLFPSALESLGDRNRARSSSSPTDKPAALFPLGVFERPASIQPYVCLQQVESLAGASPGCVLAGTVNPLLEKQHGSLCDVFVSMADGRVEVAHDTRAELRLSAADLRFCAVLSETVVERADGDDAAEAEQHTAWLGSDEWVLSQFKLYLLSLLAASTAGGGEEEEDALARDADFGGEFMSAWLGGSVYGGWRERCRGDGVPMLEGVESRHVCSGELSVGDLKRRLVAQASDYGLISAHRRDQAVYALQETQRVLAVVGGAVGGAWSTASSAVFSWWYSDSADQ